ncbi:MAG: prepilin-type N-terminal cleavage/methylation domain-containing protein [Verrucomicrobia bacterium]|nr:prepilin-type N-terminal cleavage/methylation domain-containing protein [Verrucomicrobiota bacterium]
MKPDQPTTTEPGRAFSLVELLVVLAVIGVLAGLLLPALLRARFNGKVTICLNQYRQWGIAANVYATDDGKGRLPSFRLPTNQLSFIEPWIVAHEMVTNMASYGVGVPMWFCPTRPMRRAGREANFRTLRGREFLTPADLVDEMTHIQRANYYFADLMWWVPRKLGPTVEYPDPSLLQVRTPLPWPRRLDDPTVATQPMISDWYLGTWDADRQIVEIRDNSGGHQWAGSLRGLNLGFADGHVENRPRAKLQWQARRSGFHAYVY